MASINERSLGVARLYAKAMLLVAEDQGASESLGDELAELLEHAGEDEEFGVFLSSPVLERDKRRQSLEATLRGRASDLLVDSLQVINKKDRLSILDQILEAYGEAYRELRGQIEVKVASAVALTDEQRADFLERTAQATGKRPFLSETVDPELLGGLVAQIGDEKVDMSVRRELQLLGARLSERLSSEIIEGHRFVTDSAAAGPAEASNGRDKEE